MAVPAPGPQMLTGPQALWLVRRLPDAGQRMPKSPAAGVAAGALEGRGLAWLFVRRVEELGFEVGDAPVLEAEV